MLFSPQTKTEGQAWLGFGSVGNITASVAGCTEWRGEMQAIGWLHLKFLLTFSHIIRLCLFTALKSGTMNVEAQYNLPE